MLEELGPEPEAPSAPSPTAAQPDDDEEEEELLLLQRELQGGLRTKALIVGEWRRRLSDGTPWCSQRALRSRREEEELMNMWLRRDLTGPLALPAPLQMGKSRSWEVKCTRGLQISKSGLFLRALVWLKTQGLGQTGLHLNSILFLTCGVCNLQEIT